jgi:endonuclease YncB( thermonuclease family)
VGRHWRPEGEIARIIPVSERGRDWTRIDGYADTIRRRKVWLLAAIAAAVIGGAAAGIYFEGERKPATTSIYSGIEWNEVQAVPTQAPDAEDAEWENRSVLLDGAAPPRDVLVIRGSGTTPATDLRKSPGAITVIDGDTFKLGSETIRIAGIDAPETHPPRCMEEARLGLAATEALRDLLSSGTVSLSDSGADHDQYGRLLRNVAVDGRDVGQAMIASGMARPFGAGRKPWCP